MRLDKEDIIIPVVDFLFGVAKKKYPPTLSQNLRNTRSKACRAFQVLHCIKRHDEIEVSLICEQSRAEFFIRYNSFADTFIVFDRSLVQIEANKLLDITSANQPVVATAPSI